MFGEPLVAILVSRGLSRKQHCAVEAGKLLRFRYLSKRQARSNVGSPSRCFQKASIYEQNNVWRGT